MDDIFDTRFEEKPLAVADNLVQAGQDINISAKDPTLKNLLLGAGWDLNIFGSDSLDVDVSLFLLNKSGQTRVDEDFVFYNQKQTLNGGVKHLGDSRTGAGEGDDEALLLDLHTIPFDIMRVAIVISIYKGYEKKQALESVRRAYIRIVNNDTRHEICRYELDKALTDRQETAMIAGYLDREGPKWHFKPLADFMEGGLGGVARQYGLVINQE